MKLNSNKSTCCIFQAISEQKVFVVRNYLLYVVGHLKSILEPFLADHKLSIKQMLGSPEVMSVKLGAFVVAGPRRVRRKVCVEEIKKLNHYDTSYSHATLFLPFLTTFLNYCTIAVLVKIYL